MTPETMNQALVDTGLCWTRGPFGVQLRASTDEHADPNERNLAVLGEYVKLAQRKGVTEDTLAEALAEKIILDDPTDYDGILNGPDA